MNPAVMVAAEIAGVDALYQVGGVPAIAAMAYGTGSVPKVDKICGPGNIFVSYAKKLVQGSVDIDGVFGPTRPSFWPTRPPTPASAPPTLSPRPSTTHWPRPS